MKKLLAILVAIFFGMASYAWAGQAVSGGSSFAGTESTTGSAGSVKSNATTGVMQITGPAAGTTRVVTIPDANNTIPAFPASTAKSIVYINDAGAWAVLTCDGANQMIGRNAANDGWECKTSINAAITSDEVLIDCNGSADPYAYCTSANASTLTAAYTSRTIINSYGRGEAQTVTLPAAAEGYTFIALVGTQHNSAWKIQRAGSDTITWSASGTDTTDKTYFQETNQPVGSRVSCITYKTGASAWSWLCGSITGTWVTD